MGTAEDTIWDIIIIGGGPAGSLAGLEAMRLGRRAIILEKAKFPRFHVGESFLPATLDLLKRMGLEAEFRKLPHTRKFGAEFCMGGGGLPLQIDFADGFCDGKEAFNIERSIFDNLLLREAEKAGVTVREELTVRQINRLGDGDVDVISDSGEKIRGRYLLDASGQGTVIGRHLGTKVPVADPNLQKVAYAGHFEKVMLAGGKAGGNPVIVMMEEGWFWIIPLSETRTSVGMVLGTAVAKKIMEQQQIPADRMLRWGIAQCPVMQERMQHAVGKQTNAVVADFSYKCKPYAGAGYFLIGDSAAFMDPIFSTGVCVASQGALSAVGLVDDILNQRIMPGRAREIYIRQIESATKTFFKLIGQYYDHSFRELFMQGKGPLSVHRALIGLLAGNVFPKTPWKIRWRAKIFDCLVELNRKRQIVPRRRRFSIFKNSVAMGMAASSKPAVIQPAVAPV